MLTILFGASFVVWRRLFLAWLNHRPFLELNTSLRANWTSASELAGVYIALLWVVAPWMTHVTSNSTTQHSDSETLVLVAIQAAWYVGISIFLPCLLVLFRRPFSGIGLTTRNLPEQIQIGIAGFFAAVIPMAVAMAVTLPLRPRESQHALLKLMEDSPDFVYIFVIALTAVVSAPLLEEMLFRVILQGWLTTFISRNVAISIVAVIFASVHGWRNGLALLPLAFILGYVFDRRHSYLAVVVIHALFNASMLGLQLLNPKAL